MRSIAIITARGGSKRIPGKNIKLFHGKPIIAYSIETAIKSGLFDLVMVSTDSDETAKIARDYAADVPFMRSSVNSNDTATTADVILEVMEQMNNYQFDHICCIYPTAPFVTIQRLRSSFELLKERKY